MKKKQVTKDAFWNKHKLPETMKCTFWNRYKLPKGWRPLEWTLGKIKIIHN